MKLLIIGELSGYITEAGTIAHQHGSDVTYVPSIEAGLNHLRQGRGADLVMIDVLQDVANFMQSLQQERINIAVVACGIGNDRNLAVASIKAGAKDYLPLPPDPELIAAIIDAVCTEQREVIFRDPKSEQIIHTAQQIAKSDASILITGESGTGKEVMARFIHNSSSRRDKPMVSVNCAAIPENLLESELFGHEKGAFTGAISRRIGKFEEANGGTLLLDEIGEMHPRLQAKLLRAIQELIINRVGGNQNIKVNIRLIATTNRNLQQEIKAGNFREDLFYRINVINLNLLPLRERPLDIEVLSQHFLHKYCQANGVPLKHFSPAGLQLMQNMQWPGNIRELENCIHRLVLLTPSDQIDETDIKNIGYYRQPIQVETNSYADTYEAPEATPSLVGHTVAAVERQLIMDTLDHCLGNRTHAANILGISIRTLRNKLRLYNKSPQ